MRTRLLCALGLLAVLASARSALASVSVTVQSESFAASASTTTNGFFDVIVSSTGTGNPVVQAYSAAVSLDGADPAGMTLGKAIVTDQVSDATHGSLPMLLGTDTGFASPNGALTNTSSSVSSAQDIAGTVNLDTASSGLGLMRIPFTLAAGAHGSYLIDLNTDVTTGTALANGSGFVTYTPVNGTITVSVPEPATISLALIGSAGLLMRRRKLATK